MSEELSTIDIKILDEMQKDASLSTGELAERVGLSQSPCWRRLQRLKAEGYISRQVAILNPEKFEQRFVIFANLRMETLSEERRAEFQRKVEVTPEILECYTVFGEMDVVLKVIATSLPWYQSFIFKTILKLPGVKDIQSTVTLTEIKCSTAIPLRGTRAL